MSSLRQTNNTRDEPLVTIATFRDAFEASLAKGALEAAGIRASVPSEGLGTFSRNRGGLSTSDLQVFASDRDRAVAALRRLELVAKNTRPPASE